MQRGVQTKRIKRVKPQNLQFFFKTSLSQKKAIFPQKTNKPVLQFARLVLTLPILTNLTSFMKYSILLFISLLAASLFCGYNSVQRTEAAVHADLNQALRKLLEEKGHLIAQRDTIKACQTLAAQTNEHLTVNVADATFRQLLTLEALRPKAYIVYALKEKNGDESEKMLRSDTFRLQVSPDASLSFRAYAGIDYSTLFHLTDLRLSFVLSVLAFMSLTTGLSSNRRRERLQQNDSWGGLYYEPVAKRFVTSSAETVHFTPMQQQLMQLFYMAPGHRLSQTEICDALWPKKDNAAESLYTLMRRLRKTLAEHSRLRIEADRNKGYEVIEE